MNTLQTQDILSSKAVSDPSNNGIRHNQLVDKPAQSARALDDTYSASNQSDAVIAKVVSFSLKKNVSVSVGVPNTTATSNNLNDRFDVDNDLPSFESGIEKITANVVGFVGKALNNLASQNYSHDQLTFYRNEALKGVEVGIDQAKLELVGLADDKTFESIDRIKNSILEGVQRIEVNNIIASSKNEPTKASGADFNEIEISLNNYNQSRISFNNILVSSEENVAKLSSGKNYTTSSSGISFSISQTDNKISRLGVDNNTNIGKLDEIANLVNQTDALLDDFYRGKLEASYAKSIEDGYSDEQLLSAAKAIASASSSVQTFDLPESPTQVADYLSKYLSVIESSKQVVENEQDFNEIINGLVNQMKDVQVPDLLQAINKFHSFNRKFS